MSKKQIITILNFLFFINIYGQDFAIIYDKDGFSNIRENSDINSKIIDKLKNGHLVCALENEKNWISIDYSVKNENLKNGYIYKDRLKFLSGFQKIPIKQEFKNSIIFAKDNIEVVIDQKKFEKNKHKYQYVKNYPDQILLIDNKKYFGTDGGIPTIEYKKIEIKIDNNKIQLPKIAFQNLYEPNIFSTDVNYDEKTKNLYISAVNSDGAGSYVIVWRVENGIYKERFIAYGF